MLFPTGYVICVLCNRFGNASHLHFDNFSDDMIKSNSSKFHTYAHTDTHNYTLNWQFELGCLINMFEANKKSTSISWHMFCAVDLRLLQHLYVDSRDSQLCRYLTSLWSMNCILCPQSFFEVDVFCDFMCLGWSNVNGSEARRGYQ